MLFAHENDCQIKIKIEIEIEIEILNKRLFASLLKSSIELHMYIFPRMNE